MPLFTRIPDASRAGVLDPSAAQKEIARLSALPKVHETFAWFRAHEREISDFQLAITSIQAPPFAEEKRSEFLAEEFSQLGLKDIQRDEVSNVFAALEPMIEAPSLLLSAHLDTVFPRQPSIEIRREQTRLLGPGISDNGAGLAAVWAIAAAMCSTGLCTARPLIFIGNVGEEGEGNLRGMRHIFRQQLWRERTRALLVLDGAGVDSIIAEALGSRRFEVEVTGPGGHSWSDFGVPNPIVALARAIDALSQVTLPTSPKTTINVGTISGGTSVNTIPESATMRIDVRSTSFAQLDEVEAGLRNAVAEAVAETQSRRSVHRQLKFEVRVVGDRPAAELRRDAPILQFVHAADAQLGIRARIHRASTDANIPLSLGIDALALGAGGSGGGAHTLKEWFDPTGRELALRRILLVILALAGVKE